MNPVLQQLQAEASRRGMGQPVSNTATQANPSASQPTQLPANPLASRQGMGANTKPTMPSAQDPFGGAAQMMNGALPQGGTMLEKALVKRMNLYPPA